MILFCLATCWLFVLYITEYFYCYNHTVPCPEMIRAPRNITVLPGKTANFYCLALSFGGLLYRWKKMDNTSLPESAVKAYIRWQFSYYHGHIASVNHLAIMDITQSDEGWYCCVATNECGHVKQCAWLEVNSKSFTQIQKMISIYVVL